MISYVNSQKIIEEQVSKLERKIEVVNLANALNRVLAEDIYIEENIPSFNNSAMDGFAIKCESLTNENYDKLDCVEIMTGAYVPNAFDAVIRVEDTIVLEDKKSIKIKQTVKQGENIRYAGEDFKLGNILFSKNRKINNQDIMALAALGINEVKVYQKLKIALISTGLEVVSWEEKRIEQGKIRNSTSLYLINSLRKIGAEVEYWGNVADNEKNFLEIVNSIAQAKFDMIVSTGAVSVGKFDFVVHMLEKLKADILFHKVAIRPGKPILFSKLKIENNELIFFGLPGNPIASVVGLHFFVEAFIDKFYFSKSKLIKMKLKNSFKKPRGLQTFYKAKVNFEEGNIEVLNGQASFLINSFLDANAFVILDEQKDAVLANESVNAYLL